MAADQPADRGLQALGFPEAAIRLINANNSYGNNLSDTSLMALYRVMGEFGRLSGPALAIMEAVAGNMRLPEAMAAQLAQPVATGENGNGNQPICRRRAGHAELGPHVGSRRRAAGAAYPRAAANRTGSARVSSSGVERRRLSQELCNCTASSIRLSGRASGWGGSWWTDGLLGRVFTRPMPEAERYNMTIWINGDSCDALNALDDEACTDAILQALWKLVPSAQEVTSVGQLSEVDERPLRRR